jgi:hypothetical protein
MFNWYDCQVCGGKMIGGSIIPRHCENAEEDDYLFNDPYSPPVYCKITPDTQPDAKEHKKEETTDQKKL